MAMPIRNIPVLEGKIARQFIREAKANEKKRGTHKFSDDAIASFQAIYEDARKRGVL